MTKKKAFRVSRRTFISTMGAGGLLLLLPPFARRLRADADPFSRIFHVERVPGAPFPGGGNRHAGVEALLALMAGQGLMFYRSAAADPLAGPEGMIEAGDVVLLKVNAQWKYRGCTNSDVVRGLVQRILDHPDGFHGEVVILENGQGRGSLACDTASAYDNGDVHANAVNENHSFLFLVDQIFADPRVSSYLLDPIRATFIAGDDHLTDGYRRFENVSYPCFTSAGGRRIELREGVWTGAEHRQGLKLINVPVLKTHGGCETTGALKHVYGLLSMSDGNRDARHYAGLGEACGKMMVSVRPPVLNIVDAIWVSHKSLSGYPADTTRKINALAASQDPVALDYWTAKHILYPIDGNNGHDPDNATIQRWLADAESVINGRGGLYHPEWGIQAGTVTRDEGRMILYSALAGSGDSLTLTVPNGGESWARGSTQRIAWTATGDPGSQLKLLLLKGGLLKKTISTSAPLAAGSYSWKVPASLPRGKDYALRIVSRQNPSLRDASDSPFSIGRAPAGTSLAMTAPIGGEAWKRGSNRLISWSYFGAPGAAVRIQLLKGSTVARVIAASAPLGADGSGSFSWDLPADLIPGSDYRVRVRSVAFPEVRAQSPAKFTVTR